MPLFEYKDDNNIITEVLFFINETVPDLLLINGKIAHKIISAPAFTPSKWGKRLGGINGVYDEATHTTYDTLSDQIKADSKANRQRATSQDLISVYDNQKALAKEQDKRLAIHEEQLVQQSQGKGYKLKAFTEAGIKLD